MSIPTYIIVTTPRARKILKKLPLSIRKHLIESLQVLETKPLTGQNLKGYDSTIRSFHTRYKGTDYRVIYELSPKERKITIRYAGTRENFYKQFTHYMRNHIFE